MIEANVDGSIDGFFMYPNQQFATLKKACSKSISTYITENA
jgi:hypothetical protein